MTIFLPDPDIGRCKSYKFRHCSCGHSEPLRCVDYDGIPHTCSFPESSHQCSMTRPDNNQVYTISITTPQAKPWVKPGDERPPGG